MRSMGVVSLIFSFVLVVSVGSAEGRRKATAKERAAIAARFDAPAKCARIWVSTVDRHWATYAFDGTKYQDADCKPAASDGVAILRFRKGSWRIVTAGSSFGCPVTKTPAKIVKDLHVKCFGKQ